MNERKIDRGFHAPFYWLTSTEDHVATLLQTCPEIAVGRHIAITATDSGILELTELQMAAGWRSRASIAYGPKISCIDQIPHQVAGPEAPLYQELYIFNTPCDLGAVSTGNIFEEAFAPAPGRIAVFVNWLSFDLSNPDPKIQCLVDLFWLQLECIQPESYIADGFHCLVFVSRDRYLMDSLEGRLLQRSA